MDGINLSSSMAIIPAWKMGDRRHVNDTIIRPFHSEDYQTILCDLI
jgi:hypothetical protein